MMFELGLVDGSAVNKPMLQTGRSQSVMSSWEAIQDVPILQFATRLQ